jgi:hypothetical protein
MADATDRAARITAAAEIIALDGLALSKKLYHHVRLGNHRRALEIAANLQRAARDVKWLMQRQHPGGKTESD